MEGGVSRYFEIILLISSVYIFTLSAASAHEVGGDYIGIWLNFSSPIELWLNIYNIEVIWLNL